MIRQLRARVVLIIGWVVFLLYANPGLMSFDSVQQLLRARDGQFSDDHPPMMSVVWAVCDAIVPGPLGMLLLQSGCFLVGAYLLLRHMKLTDRAAAWSAVIVLLLPPVSSVMAVIWKDAQMAGYLLLGTALRLDERRRANIGGLLLVFLASTMRHNAFVLTMPLVVMLYAPAATWRRYPLAVAAWLGITIAASLLTSTLPSIAGTERRHLWNDSMALADITGTLRYAEPIPDDQLRTLLAGTPLQIEHDVQDATRRTFAASDLPDERVASFGGGDYIPKLWVTMEHVFHRPTNDEERAAVARAWRAIIPSHLVAYATYRAHVTAERLGISSSIPSATYVWFTNVTDINGALESSGHNAAPSTTQKLLFDGMLTIGASLVFRPIVYIVLALVLLALSLRRRLESALLFAGLLGEAALFVLAPTVDYRYSFFLVVGTLLVSAARLAVLLLEKGDTRIGTNQVVTPT
jgi:hypothetical protein